MLLLILFAGCLATSVAQNITVTGMPTETITVTGAPTETITVTETPTETITVTGAPTETTVPIAFETATSAVYLPEYVAILQAYVQYAGPYDLNEITAQPILSELSQRIKQELQDSSISLKIRNITKV